MVLAIHPPEFDRGLRRFVQNRKEGLLPRFRVYGFLVPNLQTAGTITPFQVRVPTFAPGTNSNGAEVSWFPFGFIFAMDIGPVYRPRDLTDITHWFSLTDRADRKRATGEFYMRLTGVDSVQAGLGYSRNGPQVDSFAVAR